MLVKPIPIPEPVIAVLYAVAAIAGALGGCAVGAHYFRTNPKARYAFVVAYIIMGAIFGVIFFGLASILGRDPGTIHELIIYSIIAGSAGSVALFSANWTVKAVFKKFGVDVEITLRKHKEDRRAADE